MKDAPRSRDLDTLVVSIELTLISIIQGVALFFLIDSSRSILVEGRVECWPFVLTGLLVIFVFWSRSMIHTLTVIRWPLEFGHNCLYIACTFVESVMFTQAAHPFEWFTLGAVYAALVWALFLFDRRLIRSRGAVAGPAEVELLSIVEREQMQNFRYGMPATALFSGLAAFGVVVAPESWPSGAVELVLGLLQLVAGVVYLSHVLRFYARISPLIERAQEERQHQELFRTSPIPPAPGTM
jgi:hypothetical protein